jgi:hypothetical protein
MRDDRRQERQRLVRKLMRTLTGEGEPLLITDRGEVSDHQRDPTDQVSRSMSYQSLIDMRRREHEAICRQRQEQYATPEEWQQQNIREHESWQRTLEGVAYRLDLGFLIGENDALAHVIYETMMRLPDEIREFAHDHVVFLSGAWGQAFRGNDWSDKWILLLAPELPEDDATGIVAHEIAHAWRGHGARRGGFTPEEEREACHIALVWGFSGSGTRMDHGDGLDGGITTYIN